MDLVWWRREGGWVVVEGWPKLAVRLTLLTTSNKRTGKKQKRQRSCWVKMEGSGRTILTNNKFLEHDPWFQTGTPQVLTSNQGQPRLWSVWWGVSSLESKGLWASTWRRQWIILSAQPWLVRKARSSRQRSWLSKCSGCCRQGLQWPGVRAWHQPVPIS